MHRSLPLLLFIFVTENIDCVTPCISTHIFENHSIIFAVACQMTKNYSPLWTFPELDQVHCNEITMSHVQTQGLRKGEQDFIFAFARQGCINFNSKTNAHPVTSDFCLWTNGLRQLMLQWIKRRTQVWQIICQISSFLSLIMYFFFFTVSFSVFRFPWNLFASSFRRLGEKSCFRALSGKPQKMDMEILLLVGWS